ncbi:MAG: matrixin family metalloprotease [Okeania sp. SIO2C9]|uniref:PEP-CTERM sorting domain-containing protein n=1 Tax=Okeania sp. SIO2C9 TaxID=2607791 RepID=UPI0013C15BCD|nr:matrixin family metalloprotease [Okeania sp. SIO2C9]NEQ76053.1 matrixin family metalloprotease [Okeania sp. SIO2C9]
MIVQKQKQYSIVYDSVFKGRFLIAFGVATVTSLLSASPVRSIPSLNPHPHILVGFEDPANGGGGVNHHHWNPLFPLYPGNGQPNDETNNSPLASVGDSFVNISFDAYSAWDQRGNQALYRNGDTIQNFGHGFIRQYVPYSFAPEVPALARTDFNNAMTRWEQEVAALFAIDAFGAGTGRELGFNFEESGSSTSFPDLIAEDLNFNGMLDPGEDTNGNGALDGFVVTWQETPGNRAAWFPNSQRMVFDDPMQSMQTSWFFGGAGEIPANEDTNNNGMLDPGEDLNGNGIINAVTDFFTIAMHEIGHIIGLNHINTGVAGELMRSDIDNEATPGTSGGMGVRTPDIGSVFGALALYTQPISKDFGDAPNSYKTLLASDGPRYDEGELQRLGSLWDAEGDGQPTVKADGDDRSILGGFPEALDDEDGVIFGDSWVDVTFNITRPPQSQYNLRAWWDLNKNGMFDHTSELIIDDRLGLTSGTITKRYDKNNTFGKLNFDPRDFYSRFRLTFDPIGDVKPFGEVFSRDCPDINNPVDCISHGEVEDYAPVPEPSSILGLFAIAGLGLTRLRKKR